MTKESKGYINILKAVDMDPQGRKAAVQAVANSDILVHGRPVPFSYIPLLINEKNQLFFKRVLEMTQSILSKMTRHYIEDPLYRRIFGFSSEMERLICLPCNYPEIIPVGRYDLFIMPRDTEPQNFWFCEFNTDGSSGMSRDGFIAGELLKGLTIQKMQENYSVSVFPIIETITESLIDTYFSDKNAVEHPNICITDFKEEGVMSDFDRFAACFRKRGINSRFVDVRDLLFNGEHLIDRRDGLIVHGLYRRLVTSVLLERQDECQALIDAVAAEKVVLLGHFRTSLAHSKVVNLAMFHPETKALLTNEENTFIAKHVPQTYALTSEALPQDVLNDALAHKDHWIIKPEEGFGAHGVYAGVDQDLTAWQALLNRHQNDHYLLQQFIHPETLELLGPEEEQPSKWPVMIGVYQAAGQLAGFYNRAGKEGVIDFEHGGIFLPTVVVKSKDCNFGLISSGNT